MVTRPSILNGDALNTITHALVAATLLARPNAPRRNRAVFVGALLPDLWILGFYGWSRATTTVSVEEIWTILYWQEPWQSIGAVFNSVPLFAILLLGGLVLRSTILTMISAAALLHLGLDFPVHADDAHRHFWPLTDWRFISPVSYWDPAHHGAIVSAVEALGALGLIIVLWRRFSGRFVKVALSLAALGYVAVPAYFIWSIGLN